MANSGFNVGRLLSNPKMLLGLIVGTALSIAILQRLRKNFSPLDQFLG